MHVRLISPVLWNYLFQLVSIVASYFAQKGPYGQGANQGSGMYEAAAPVVMDLVRGWL